MATRADIERYRAGRSFTLLNDDEIAWMVDNAPDCAADVPVEIKQRLEEAGAERPLGPIAPQMTPIVTYDFASLPHGGRWRPLPEAGTQAQGTKVLGISHSIVGSAESAFQLFANSSDLESTNIVGDDGFLWQIMSRIERADANRDANTIAVSTETSDNGDPDNDPWTEAQMDTLVAISLQDATDFGVARQRAPDCNGPGFGFHTLFGAPSCWTPVAKTCPGRIRKEQWFSEVLPRIIEGVIDMGLTADDRAFIKTVVQGSRGIDNTEVIGKVEKTYNQVNIKAGEVLADAHASYADLKSILVEVLAKLNALGSAPGGGATKAEVDEVVRAIFGDAAVAS